MIAKHKNLRARRKAVALIAAIIFLAVFGAFAAAMVSMSGTNVHASSNQQKVGRAFTSAQSGLEIMRYIVNQVAISGKTADYQIVTALRTSMQSAFSELEVTGLTTSTDGLTINIPAVTLDSATNQSFVACITRVDTNTVDVDVTGMAGDVTRTVRVKYDLVKRSNNVFDFGVATKGPLSLQGNISVEGVTLASDADVYIESLANDTALEIIGKCAIEGDVKIVNPDAVPSLSPQARIGGEGGSGALDHVEIGAPPTEWPEPDPSVFTSYATGPVIYPGDPLPAALTNAVIAPGVNPSFAGNVTISGVLYIQQPNIVDFGGNVNITGVIVCDGDVDNPLASNKLIFRGDVYSQSVETLPAEPQFDGLRTKTGTFCLAPGFSISMGGSFGTINGAIAANGVEFFGNAGGTIAGSVINYSDTPMTLTGNSDIFFNRSGISDEVPGFVPYFILGYDTGSYEEPLI